MRVTRAEVGAQETRGSPVALEVRGCRPDDADLVRTWTLRGPPHAYRRSEVAEVAAATAPWDGADAAKRIFDAARPLREAGSVSSDFFGNLRDARGSAPCPGRRRRTS